MIARVSRWIAGTTIAGALAAAATAALAADPIKIGVVLPYVPPFGVYSKAVEITMKMALEEEGGAVAGRKIELLFEDDENKPPTAIAKSKKLILNDKVDVVIGGLASNLAVPMAPVMIENKIPFVVVNAGASVLTQSQCNPWVVRISFSNDQIVRPSGKWLYDRGIKTAYIMAADYTGGHDIARNFQQAFEAVGGKVVGTDFAPLNTTDFGPHLAKAKAAKADTVYNFFPGALAIQFVKQYHQFGLKSDKRLTGPVWTVSPIFAAAQKEAAIGFVGPINYIYTIDTPENKRFVEAYRAKSGGQVPDEVSVNGYDAVKFTVKALAALNGKTDDKAAFMREFVKVSYTGPRGLIQIDPKTHNVIQDIYMVEVRDKGGQPDFAIVDVIKREQDPPMGCKL
jgi:branched-chain amino acid transport system substrate-binding protein